MASRKTTFFLRGFSGTIRFQDVMLSFTHFPVGGKVPRKSGFRKNARTRSRKSAPCGQGSEIISPLDTLCFFLLLRSNVFENYHCDHTEHTDHSTERWKDESKSPWLQHHTAWHGLSCRPGFFGSPQQQTPDGKVRSDPYNVLSHHTCRYWCYSDVG